MALYNIVGTLDISFVLWLNMMRNRVESRTEVARFDTREEAIAFYKGELVEHYTDEGPNFLGDDTQPYRKYFRKGGPLEWFNPIMEEDLQGLNHRGFGIEERWSQLTIESRSLVTG